jgi:drug/metabolite transporter (DMT)-like permease
MVFSTRFVIDQTDPVTLAFLRFGIGSACIAPILLGRTRPVLKASDWPGIVGLGLVLYSVMPACLAAGLQFTYASRGALILVSQPVFTLLLSRWRGEERFTRAKLLGITLAALGLALVLGEEKPPDTGNRFAAIGDLLLLLAACCVAAYNVYSRPYLKRYSAAQFTALTMTIGALALAPFAAVLALTRGAPAFTPLGWTAILYIGTFGAAVGYLLWVSALRTTTPTRVAIFLSLNPLTATFLGWALLDEPITSRFLMGLVAVLVGIIITNRPDAGELKAAA